jgi:hypothetical protein
VIGVVGCSTETSTILSVFWLNMVTPARPGSVIGVSGSPPVGGGDNSRIDRRGCLRCFLPQKRSDHAHSHDEGHEDKEGNRDFALLTSLHEVELR